MAFEKNEVENNSPAVYILEEIKLDFLWIFNIIWNNDQKVNFLMSVNTRDPSYIVVIPEYLHMDSLQEKSNHRRRFTMRCTMYISQRNENKIF